MAATDPTIATATSLQRDGFALVARVLQDSDVANLRRAIEGPAPAASAGRRDVVAEVPTVRALAESSTVRALVEPWLGRQAQLVRSILFHKSMHANWLVAWHQDLSIAVAEHGEVAGFEAWSTKNGVPHVQPPVEVLERMLTVRLHIDAAGADNGALCVAPGSHRLGRVPPGEAAELAERTGEHVCVAAAGDALLMRPLLLHRSRKATSSRPRRVIHLEFAGVTLPAPLRWRALT